MKAYKKIICVLLAVVIVAGSTILAFPSFEDLNFPDFSNLFQNDRVEEETRYSLQISATAGGSVDHGGGTYTSGDLIHVTATPDDGYLFAYWADEKGKCLTSYNVYSMEMKRDTRLVAHFVEKPKDLIASGEQNDVLLDCADNFSFTVECDRPDAATYLKENLSVVNDMFLGTEYEEAARAEFDITPLGDGKYQVTPAAGQTYEKGLTYTAVLPEDENDTRFLQNGVTGDTLSFSVQADEEESVTEYVSGIICIVETEDASRDQVFAIVDDGLTAGEENDIEDYLILSETFGISANSIICIHDGEEPLGENKMPSLEHVVLYAKAESVTLIEEGEYSGKYKVVYGQPELGEIFSELNVAHKDSIDFENSDIGITEETLEEIRHAILADEQFQNLVYVTQLTFTKEVGAQGYELQQISRENLVDMVDIQISYQKKGDKFIIKIAASMNFGIFQKGTKNQVAQISLSLNVIEEYSISVGAQVSLRYWWFIPTGINYVDINSTNKRNSKTDFSIGIAYDKGSAGMGEFDENFDKEKLKADIVNGFANGRSSSWRDSQHIKEIFDANGYKTSGNRRFVRLFEYHWYFGGIFSANLELQFFFEFDLEGSLIFSTSSYTNKTDGLRYSGGRFRPYSNVAESVTVKGDHILAGTVGLKTGLKLDVYLSFIGLSKYIRAGIYGEMGLYATASGFVSVETGHLAGKFEAGMYYRISLYAKAFSLYAEHTLVSGEHALIKYGYSEAYLYYPMIADPENVSIVLSQKETDLFSQDLFRVASLSIDDATINNDRLDPLATQYKIRVSLADGSYLSYNEKSGKFVIKDGAPAFFTDTITVRVESGNKWGSYRDNSICAYLPTVSIQVAYGNYDAYVESLDTEMQRYFRNIYKNYNSANAALLQSGLESFVGEGTDLSDSEIYDCIFSNYASILFSTIEAAKAEDIKNGNRMREHAFVAAESEAFKNTARLINALAENGGTLTERTVNEVLSLLLDSSVMYETMLMSLGDERLASLSDVLDGEENADKRTAVVVALQGFEKTYAGDPRAAELTAAIRDLFRLEED